MDDSERTYGYSEDIYHGSHDRKDEKSYEYGAENPEEVQGEELSPEEAAMHIEGSHAGEEPIDSGETGSYDYGREGGFATTESFTWDIPGTDVEREAQASETKVRTDQREERVAAGSKKT
ncbi:MAG TPA: hypothetical protein VLB76_17885 [Thermoanaerobaculia bacterium]|jgi:hypothetical protein|nr:hypothetical protein [Thermoanaerobaculia bacterium]